MDTRVRDRESEATSPVAHVRSGESVTHLGRTYGFAQAGGLNVCQVDAEGLVQHLAQRDVTASEKRLSNIV